MDPEICSESLNSYLSFFEKGNYDVDFSLSDLKTALQEAGFDGEYILEETQLAVNYLEYKGLLKNKYKNLSIANLHCVALCNLELPRDFKGKSPFSLVDSVLRGRRCEENLLPVRRLIVYLLISLRKLPRAQMPSLYGRIRWNVLENEVGKEITFSSFASMFTSLKHAESFCYSGCNVLVVEGPVFGYDLRDFSRYPEEYFILLEPDTSVRITGVSLSNGKKVIQSCVVNTDSALLSVAPFCPSSTKPKA